MRIVVYAVMLDFQEIYFQVYLPDPTPHPLEKEHYMDFESLYGTETNENHLSYLHDGPRNGVLADETNS